MEPRAGFKIKRKPVVVAACEPDSSRGLETPQGRTPEQHPPLPPSTPISGDISRGEAAEGEPSLTGDPSRILPPRGSSPVAPDVVPSAGGDGLALSLPPTSSPTATTRQAIAPDEGGDARDKPSFLRHALEETRFFVGGLIERPHESTKHYTILRHSPSVIFYRGPATSVAITIFSSSRPSVPLPESRTVWLQQRGVSGNTGMKLRRLVGATSSWLDVTPTTQVSASELAAPDRRRWQRDIDRFTEAAARDKTGGHVPRETHVIRLPAAAGDGYFRLVLCAASVEHRPRGGKEEEEENDDDDDADNRRRFTRRRVLCTSPIFRIASTSADPSVFRGASLKTLPLELGVMAGSIAGSAKVAGLLAPVTSAVQGQLQKVQPGFVAREAAATAYQASGLPEKMEAAEEADPWDYAGEEPGPNAMEPLDEGAEVDMDVVGPDAGPEPPFPIRFTGKMIRYPELADTSLPAAMTLDAVPDHITLCMKGIYLGWACIPTPRGDLDNNSRTSPPDWHEAVVEVGPPCHAAPSVAARRVVTVRFAAHDPGLMAASSPSSAKVEVVVVMVMVMGFIRPADTKASRGERQEAAAAARDARTALSSLSRSSWGPELILARAKTAEGARSLSERYTDARRQLQQRAHTAVPLHWAGIRSSGEALRDRALGNGGYWIARG